MEQIQHKGVALGQAKDLSFDSVTMRFKLINVIQALAQFSGLLRRNSTVNGGLNLLQRMLAPFVNEWSNIKRFAGMLGDVFGNRHCRFAEYTRKDIIQLQVGDSQAVLCAVLLSRETVGQF